MKKMITMISIMISTLLTAPPNNTVVVFESEGISYYEPLIRAIVMVESSNGKHMWNPEEEAIGHFQIRQIRVDDYNRQVHANYVLTDFKDYNLSRQMFLYYAKGKKYEWAAKDWNGSGYMVKGYWKKVKIYL